jgi:acetate kinase
VTNASEPPGDVQDTDPSARHDVGFSTHLSAAPRAELASAFDRLMEWMSERMGERDDRAIRWAHGVAKLRPTRSMKPVSPRVLAINGGSSSIRFSVYEANEALVRICHGKVDRIGLSGTVLQVGDPPETIPIPHGSRASDHNTAVRFLLGWLEDQPGFDAIKAVGHRIVHGMRHSVPEKVTSKLLAELHRLTPYVPDHLPRELSLIEAVASRHPRLPQVACFDTAFHRTMPQVAKQLPIPRRYAAKGVQRYGFHGISYAYLLEELSRLDPAGAKGRVILAHLGNGASLAAVRNGESVDTSMGFTPAAGLVMGSRSGDLDPGLTYFLARNDGMTAAQFQHMVNHESGLLGVSGTSSDLRDLCAREDTDSRAAEAVNLFCYQVKKWVGSFAAALGGLDTLIFSAGIGENAPLIRQRVCDGLGFLGVELDPQRNAKNLSIISPEGSGAKIRIVRTDEELMLAKYAIRALNLGSFRQN